MELFSDIFPSAYSFLEVSDGGECFRELAMVILCRGSVRVSVSLQHTVATLEVVNVKVQKSVT